MGQYLSFPQTEKKLESGQDERLVYGFAAMQGWRSTMEDAHTMRLQLDDNKRTKNSFFAIFDGHGGKRVANHAGDNVYKLLAQQPSYFAGNYQDALKMAFLDTDEYMAKDRKFFNQGGCTAVAVLVTEDNKIFVANAGDSRSVLCIKGEEKPLSYDHKPSNTSEEKRIENAGGYVENGRVNESLAVSRGLGDFRFKENRELPPEAQIITADPDIIEHHITEEDEFFIIACDGIWDCLKSQQCVDIVRLLISQGKELSEITKMVCDLVLAPDTNTHPNTAITGYDNMSLIVVGILGGRTKEEWYTWITERVKEGYGRQTPDTLPQLYSESRLLRFKSIEAVEIEFQRRKQEREAQAPAPSSENSV